MLPWDHLDSGLDKDWLWEDWQDALDEVEVDDCRWTPCFDCGVCPQMGTDIQIGPTGRTLLPIAAVTHGVEPDAAASCTQQSRTSPSAQAPQGVQLQGANRWGRATELPRLGA